ncbi:MAG TPA: copper homeostasis protein CutC [Phycisphaerales bacterium]|nr:copper homeostasis protein CutC [Phycisphaerales bacterium]
MTRVLLEIAVDSLADAIKAQESGADRLELVADLANHGVTPPVQLLRDVKAAVTIPVVAMVRPDAGSPIGDPRMVARMLNQAEELLAAGADGLVFGVLTPAGHIDRDAAAMMVQLAGRKETIFHRAFDLTHDPIGSVGTLIDRGVTRVLTSGLDARATAAIMGLADPATAAPPPGLVIRLRRIHSIMEAAQGRLEVLPCGGVRSANAQQFLDETGATQLHSASRAAGTARLDPAEVANLRFVLDQSGS